LKESPDKICAIKNQAGAGCAVEQVENLEREAARFAERLQSLVARGKALETFGQEYALCSAYEKRELEDLRRALTERKDHRLAWGPLSVGTLGKMAAIAEVIGVTGAMVVGVMAGEAIDGEVHPTRRTGPYRSEALFRWISTFFRQHLRRSCPIGGEAHPSWCQSISRCVRRRAALESCPGVAFFRLIQTLY
jgi:hypothetical protein